MDDIYYDPRWRVLICKVHGTGMHSTPQAIVRHLRGDGHAYGGKRLKDTLMELVKLALAPSQDLLRAHVLQDRAATQRPIPHLRIFKGFRCTGKGCDFLTTSLELQRKHSRKCRAKIVPSRPRWERCKLQTIFQETKHRRYFVVGDTDDLPGEECEARKDLVAPSTNELQTGPGNSQDLNLGSGLVSLLNGNKPEWSLNPPHPIAQLASKHIRYLNLESLDRMFRSPAFCAASSPLFDPNHIGAQHGIFSVFPGCENDPAFLHALVYAMLQFTPEKEQNEDLSKVAKRQTVSLLNRRLTPTSVMSPSLIGAVSILKTSALKTDDVDCHAIHTKGLTALLQKCDQSLLTAGLRRSLFWQNLYGRVFLGDTLPIPWQSIAEEVVWHGDEYNVPRGFIGEDMNTPHELLQCVVNILEFQAIRRNTSHFNYDVQYQQSDSMQASIESRLVNLKDSCIQHGLHVEAIRLAIFLCCHYSGLHVSKDNLISCKLAFSLCELLEATLVGRQAATIWKNRWDVLIWTLLIGSCAIEESDSTALKQLRRRVVYLTRAALADCQASTAVTGLEAALCDFIYSEGWLESKRRILDWADMEDSIKQTYTKIVFS